MRNGKSGGKELTWIRYRLKKTSLRLERRKTLKQLGALNNHMLRDIGLERAQIVAIVDRINDNQTRLLQEQRRADQQARAAAGIKYNSNGCAGAGNGS